MTFSTHKTASYQGSALLVVLWVIALLSFLVVTTMMVIMQDVESVGARNQVFRARQLAEMGIAVAAHPSIKMGDPLLERQLSSMEGYRAIISTEESLLNINAMLTDDRRLVLEQLFVQQGLASNAAQTLVNRMMDWVDADDSQRLDSMERHQYQERGWLGRPYNRPFRNLDEVELVSGMEDLVAVWPQWRESFTVHGDGKLDINEASPRLIALVTGINLATAEQFAVRRNGLDGKRYTLDDTPYLDLEEAFTWLGSGGISTELMSSLLTVQGGTRRIVSTGYAGTYARSITVVTKQGGDRPQMLDWRETVSDQ